MYTAIVGKYSTCIAQSMVVNIKKNALKVEAIKKSMEMGSPKTTSKTMKTGKYKMLNEVLCIYVYCDGFVLDLWVNNFEIIHWMR